MTLTYKAFLLNRQLEAFKDDIQIVETISKNTYGAMVRFTCSNPLVLDEIFDER